MLQYILFDSLSLSIFHKQKLISAIAVLIKKWQILININKFSLLINYKV